MSSRFRQFLLAALSAFLILPTLSLISYGAADFSHAKQLYVPPSKIERRIDFEALREYEAVLGDSHKNRHQQKKPVHHKIQLKLSSNEKDSNIVRTNIDLTQKLLLNPNNTTASRALIDLWQKQVTHSPTANSYIGLGKTYQLIGNLYLAQNAYNRASSIDPYNANLIVAKQSFQLALTKNQATAVLKQANLLERYHPIAALQYIAQVLAHDPYNLYFLIYEGQLYKKLGQIAYAQTVLTSALQIDPGNKLAASLLSSLPTTYSMSPGYSTDGDVSQLSNLLIAVRNAGFAEKQRMQEFEQKTHQALEQSNFDFNIDSILSSSKAASALYALGPTPVRLNSN